MKGWLKMRNFNPEYIKLLRTQVEEEIKYLQAVGHTLGFNDYPCIFCYETTLIDGDYAKKYKCNRLKLLQDFQSDLNVRERTHGNSALPGGNTLGQKTSSSPHYNNIPTRRPIGQPDSIDFSFNINPKDNKNILELLPQVPVNLKFYHIPLKPPYARFKGIKIIPTTFALLSRELFTIK